MLKERATVDFIKFFNQFNLLIKKLISEISLF